MRALTTILALLALSGTAAAREVMYHDNLVPTVFSDDVWRVHEPVDFSIRYDTERETLRFHTVLDDEAFGFVLTRDQARTFGAIVEKYREWNRKASRMSVELEKEIAPLPVVRTYWSAGEATHTGSSVELPVYFFSRTEQKHLLVITFPLLHSRAGARYQARSLYFDWANAGELRRALDEEVLEAFLARPHTPAEVAEQFD